MIGCYATAVISDWSLETVMISVDLSLFLHIGDLSEPIRFVSRLFFFCFF